MTNLLLQLCIWSTCVSELLSTHIVLSTAERVKRDVILPQSPGSKEDVLDDDSSSSEVVNLNSTAASVPPEIKSETTFGQDRLSDLKIIDQLLRAYDRRATPTNKIGRPTEVGCELFIRSFGSISEKTMDYQVDLYLRQHWEDPRLNHKAIAEALDLNDPKLVQAIWKPEVYFPNAKEGEFQYVTVPNVLLRIKPNGQILYMLRLKMKFSCMMELNKYPLDVQVCTMEIASFSKTTRELLLAWNKENPVDLSSDLKMPQFTMEQVVTDHCEELSLIGNYSCLVAKFHLSRSVGFHMVQSYIPTILIVVISWVSFWMDVDAVPGRTTLGVTTLLTVSSKSAGLNAETPQVSYVKAIDVWMGACTAFIFAALIEFTVVNYMWRRQKLGFTMEQAAAAAEAAAAGARASSGGQFGHRGMAFTLDNSVFANSNEDENEDDEVDETPMLGEDMELKRNQQRTSSHLTSHLSKGTEAPSGQNGQSLPASSHLREDGSDGSCGRIPETGERMTRMMKNPSSSFGMPRLTVADQMRLFRYQKNGKNYFASCGIRFDESCRVLFPFLFMCFNIFYWWYYLYH